MRTLALLLLSACGSGTWVVETWGEDYIEAGIPAADFADGCALTYDKFEVTFTEVWLIDGNDEQAAALDAPFVIDLTEPGPTELGRADVKPNSYDTVHMRIAPDAGAPSVIAEGTLTCDGEAKTFAWAFDTDTTYGCEPDELSIAAGGEDRSQLTIHGDHLWYDSLSAEDAEVRGQHIAAADADDDDVITQAELAAVPVAPTGLDVGPYSTVTDLGAYVRFLTQTVGHIDGEGHCQVDL